MRTYVVLGLMAVTNEPLELSCKQFGMEVEQVCLHVTNEILFAR